MMISKFAGMTTIVSAVATIAAVAETELAAAIVFLFGTILGGVCWYALKAVPETNKRFQDMQDQHRDEMDKRDQRSIEATEKIVSELKQVIAAATAERRAELEYWRQHNGYPTNPPPPA